MTESLSSVFDVIDKVIVITLASSADRQNDMTNLLQGLGVPFEFHFGRDCRNETAANLAATGDYDAEARLRSGRPEMTPAEIGCALSHRDVASRIATGSDNRVLVFEDDIRAVAPRIWEFDDCIRAMPARWNLAYFGYAAMNLRTPLAIRLKLASYYPLAYMLGSTRHKPSAIRRTYRRPLNSHWMHAGWFNNAHAYALDRTAARIIAESQTPVRMEADIALNHLVRDSDLEAICMKEPIFEQRLDVPSVIGARPSWH